MSLIDSYRRNIERKNAELVRLHQDKAAESKKVADFSAKINSANQAIGRTSSPSTIKSKMAEIERYRKGQADAERKIADISVKIGKKQKETNDEQSKLSREEANLQKKQVSENLKQQREHQSRMTNITRSIARHESMHSETLSKIEALQALPEKIVVLFLASNPINQQQLRLDEEARAINEMIRGSKHRDAVKLETRWAVRPLDVLQALNELEPTVVHFSGHGSDNDQIVFQSANGKAQLVTTNALTQTMAASSDSIRLVFFNTCHSYNQARKITDYVEAAIGMNTSIGDEAARIFAAQFYSAIGFGHSLKKAFDQGKAAIMLEGIYEESTPELYIRNGFDADQIFLLRVKEDGYTF
jgi:hypothetical protein